jgi:L-threonylcarbamoyladenylate synthase
VGLESTIIGFAENKVIVHRLGGITIEQIKRITGLEVELALSHASPKAPGQLKSHYATTTPFLLGDVEALARDYQGKKIGIISFRKSYENLHPTIEVILSPSGDLNEAATKLFSAMRELDSAELDAIISERFPEEGVGLAINDRLERAAY